MKIFHHILGNTLVASVTNFTVWFTLTFSVFLATRSGIMELPIVVDKLLSLSAKVNIPI